MVAPPQSAPPSDNDLVPSGVLLRWSTPADGVHLASLCEAVFCENEPRFVGSKRAQVARLMHGDHPMMAPGDVAIAVDERLRERGENPVVSCVCLVTQDVMYDGVEFKLGRPENVATRREYRRRGLVRRLMDIVHARCEAEGILVLAIAGIHHFYRQFGYEYALSLGGQRTTLISMLPPLKPNTLEPYTLRSATATDTPLIRQLIEDSESKHMVRTLISTSTWLYYLQQPPSKPKNLWDIHVVIDTATLKPCGALAIWSPRWYDAIDVKFIELLRNVPLQIALPSIARQILQLSTPQTAVPPDPLTQIIWSLGPTHRVYDVLNRPGTYPLAAVATPPYAWYVRIPSLARFLMHVAPALERRLAASDCHRNYTGELRVHFYAAPGFRLEFGAGRVVRADEFRVNYTDAKSPVEAANVADARFPPMVFWKCVLGYRSVEEVLHMYPDAGIMRVEAIGLLETLFPKRESCLRGLYM
ncbi:GNAT domain-containing protein [Jimgerdemannia flammicorona]|uniref:GNAT domain-containing protein n=1 Tax=Jimgerdemannia flammicorona TaxID=994334 RepID=A0A433QWB4_9FUNG|nr:GNAT domain-containing protein [Jimgerdemannia flammicorona]